MLMQAYDFLVLNQRYGCCLQMGGDDQWSNILAGADLIRRKEGKPSYGATITLLANSDGKKMGKTAKGAVWLDSAKTTPFDFFQYWRNVEDDRVDVCMKLLTFMELDEIAALCQYKDERMNIAKERLAYEVTAIVHGKDVADSVLQQVKASFTLDVANMPMVEVESVNSVIDILVATELCKSRGEARRLIEGGGVYINDDKVTSWDAVIPAEALAAGELILHKGKKVHLRVILK
jgi:tyrosyl-tRNA synthetase